MHAKVWSFLIVFSAVLAPSVARAIAPPSTDRQFLSGADRDHTVDWDFFCTAGRNSGTWKTIPVPSCWEMQDFGNLNYYRDDPEKPFEQGRYRHSFRAPESWNGRRVFLVFEGAMTDTEAKLNGQPAGPVHRGGFYRFKYDVTKLIRFGDAENVLEVTVAKHSSDESINRAERTADYWVFGGIYRPVYLEAVPQDYIDRVAIDAKADGSFAIDVVTPTITTADQQIEVELIDSAGASVARFAGRTNGGAITGRVDAPSTWTAETPMLYTAKVRLRDGDRTLHEVTQRFGFRTVEVRKGDGIYINGRRVTLKGVCRHAFWPDSGRTLSPRLDRLDIELIKDMNMNAVRMSHYPPDQSFLDLCDALGLYVLDELAGWQKSYDTPNARRLVAETVTRDVNHPCILFWDNGNEGGWNKAVDDDFAKWDPQHRAVLHPWELHDGVDTKHYPNYALLTERLVKPNVFMPTEFLHGLYDGGAGAGFRDYWDAMSASKVSAGTFFWVLADEGVARPDEGGRIDVCGNGAPDGIVGPYRQREASAFTIKRIWSPIQIDDVLPPDFDGRIGVTNRYDFTSLDRVKFRWQLRRWPAVGERSGGGEDVLATGNAVAPPISPGSRGTITLELPPAARVAAADALALTVSDWNGDDLWTWVWPLKDQTRHAAASEPQTPAANATAGELRSGDVVLRFDPTTAVIRSVECAGRPIPFANGPRLALGAPRSGKGEKPHGRLVSARWTPGKDGWFRLDYTIEANGDCEYLGVTFDLPENEVAGARRLGTGPYRVWKNRMEGGTLGVWDNRYNNTITGWSEWKYPEFKGYFADLHWAEISLRGGGGDRGATASTISIAPETAGLFLHLLTPELPPGDLPRTAVAPFPDGTISLLHAIPAVGTKFDAADALGPQSQLFHAAGKYVGTVWFRAATAPN